MHPRLSISDLHIAAGDREIVRGINLTINAGEVHVIMGPNGSGKSTFVGTLMGHPAFTVTKGTAMFDGRDLFKMEPHERAQAGLFLAFQYPKEIAGVCLRNMLFAASNGRSKGKKRIPPLRFRARLSRVMEELRIDPDFAERSMDSGFSGGEKKKMEIAQMKILQPRLALLDETDSGLDIDALRIVAEGVNAMRDSRFAALIVTHYARILEYIRPDFVHVMVGGAIVESGSAELAKRLEREGYLVYNV